MDEDLLSDDWIKTKEGPMYQELQRTDWIKTLEGQINEDL